MTSRKLQVFLALVLVSAACGKRAEKENAPEARDGEPDRAAMEQRLQERDACLTKLAACTSATGWPDVPEPARRDPAPQPAADPPVVEEPEFQIKVGATYVIGQGDRAVVMNSKPVDDGVRRFPPGAVCRYDPEAKVKIIGKRAIKEGDEEDIEYLVRYTRDPSAEELRPGAIQDADADPYECPTGTVFFMDDVSMLEEHEPDLRFDAARKLLNSEKP